MRLKQINGLLVVEGLKLPLADQRLLAKGESITIEKEEVR